jgi:hypothetical protein
MRLFIFLLLTVFGVSTTHAAPTEQSAKETYRWKRRRTTYEPLSKRIAPPPGAKRVVVKDGSYAYWLRHLPLLPKGSPVLSYHGQTIVRRNHPALAAVVDIDVGKRDLQQCMDTIMRLRGEYLGQRGQADRVAFAWPGLRHFSFKHWRHGLRPKRVGRRWKLVKKNRVWRGYRSLRRYLVFMFAWTGTIHQRGERRVKLENIRAGDFFVQAGSPGHAVVVLDLARDKAGNTYALLGQGYMPAQDMHVLHPKGSKTAWFLLQATKKLATPLWPTPFMMSDLRRFRR